jgi:orotate phosphoribosyltransferase
MTLEEQVAELMPERRGHFVYESGHHGRVWLNLERLLLHPARVRPLAGVLAERLRALRPDAVCGPLVEGAFVGLMVADALGVPFAYSVPTAGDAGGLFPVSYPIPEVLRGDLAGRRVAVVNDVINAGSAVRGTLASLVECGAKPVAILTLAVYGDAARALVSAHDVPLETLAEFASEIWEPTSCPLCENGEPLSPTGP